MNFAMKEAKQIIGATNDLNNLRTMALPIPKLRLDPRELSVSPEAFLERIGRMPIPDKVGLLAAGIAPFNVADFDGTFIRDSSGVTVVREFLRRGLARPVIRQKLDALLELFGLTSGDQALPDRAVNGDAQRVLAAYERWAADHATYDPKTLETIEQVYAFYSWVFAGHSVRELQDLADEVFRDKKIYSSIFEGSREIIRTLEGKGIRTIIISATADFLVKLFAEPLGLDRALIQGMPIFVDSSGIVGMELAAPATFREGKVVAARRIMAAQLGLPQEVVETLNPLMAMGDSPAKTDQQLLMMAKVSVITEPQTPADVREAILWELGRRKVVLLDYQRTVDGRPADRFRAADPWARDVKYEVI